RLKWIVPEYIQPKSGNQKDDIYAFGVLISKLHARISCKDDAFLSFVVYTYVAYPGEQYSSHQLLRAFKNRFGSTNEEFGSSLVIGHISRNYPLSLFDQDEGNNEVSEDSSCGRNFVENLKVIESLLGMKSYLLSYEVVCHLVPGKEVDLPM
ncbi:hypothetical protein Tco_0282556, partial [Tanacetum coccineum]